MIFETIALGSIIYFCADGGVVKRTAQAEVLRCGDCAVTTMVKGNASFDVDLRPGTSTWLVHNGAVPSLEVRTEARHEVQLDRCRSLADGWDGRRAAAPSVACVDAVERLLFAAARSSIQIADVVPDVEGGIAVYLLGGELNEDGGWSRQAAIMVFNDGDPVLYLRERGASGPLVEDLEPTLDSLVAALRQAEAFVLKA